MPKVKTKKQRKSDDSSQPRLFTPGFLNRLLPVSKLLFGEDEANRMINLLRSRKKESELKDGLQQIFNAIPDNSDNWSKGVWEALEALLKEVARFDKNIRDQLDQISKAGINEKRTAYIEVLKHKNFSRRCAQLIAWTDQEQIDRIVKNYRDFFTDAKSSQANQQLVASGPSQIGVCAVELLFTFFRIMLASQRPLNPESLLSSSSKQDSSSTHKPYLVMKS